MQSSKLPSVSSPSIHTTQESADPATASSPSAQPARLPTSGVAALIQKFNGGVGSPPSTSAARTSTRPRQSLQATLGRQSSVLQSPDRQTLTPPVRQPLQAAVQPSSQPAVTPTAQPLTSAVSAQPAAAQPSTGSVPLPTSLHVDMKDAGSEKLWVCPQGSSVGWLQPHASTNPAVMDRERATIKKLAGMGFPVAKVIEGPPPTSITNGTTNVPVASGMWMEKVESLGSGKPKLMGGRFAGEKATNLVKKLQAEGVDLGALRKSLQSLHGNADELCKHVGELDLYFGRDGQVKLLDVAPDPTGAVIADDSEAVKQVKTGMDRMMAAIDQLVPAAATGHTGRVANAG